MLDTIDYTKNEDGSFTKTVINVMTVEDIASELTALQAQLADFQLGDISDEISAAIVNYQQQIAILQAY